MAKKYTVKFVFEIGSQIDIQPVPVEELEKIAYGIKKRKVISLLDTKEGITFIDCSKISWVSFSLFEE